MQWQNALLSLRDDDGKGYSQTYLRTIQNQLNAIFNHAVKYYDLPKNPCIANKKMGKSKSKEMLFWTMDEYLKFSEMMKEKPISYYAFQILYWTGIRCGELLALTRADFDLEKRVLSMDFDNAAEILAVRNGIIILKILELLQKITNHMVSVVRFSFWKNNGTLLAKYTHHICNFCTL